MMDELQFDLLQKILYNMQRELEEELDCEGRDMDSWMVHRGYVAGYRQTWMQLFDILSKLVRKQYPIVPRRVDAIQGEIELHKRDVEFYLRRQDEAVLEFKAGDISEDVYFKRWDRAADYRRKHQDIADALEWVLGKDPEDDFYYEE